MLAVLLICGKSGFDSLILNSCPKGFCRDCLRLLSSLGFRPGSTAFSACCGNRLGTLPSDHLHIQTSLIFFNQLFTVSKTSVPHLHFSTIFLILWLVAWKSGNIREDFVQCISQIYPTLYFLRQSLRMTNRHRHLYHGMRKGPGTKEYQDLTKEPGSICP